jgi:hypothetical protein
MLYQTIRITTITAAALLLLVSHLPAGSPDKSLKTPILEEAAKEKFDWGKILFNARLRYEYADQDGLEESNALTLRTRLGYQTPEFHGFNLLVEGENILILNDEDDYNQAGLSGKGRTVIADPETTELNRLQLEYKNDYVDGIVGRQKIVLDDERFIGDVGWRQNQQTFDAVTLAVKPIDKLGLYYGYIDQVLRVFGEEHPQGSWESESHLVRAEYEFSENLKLVGFGYLLRIEDSPALSGDSYGFRATGKLPLGSDLKFAYALSGALQTDNQESPADADFIAEYVRVDTGVEAKAWSLTATYERMGSDNGHAFQTPLATLHKFNGWADVFLITPKDGLNDYALTATWKIANLLPLTVAGHQYTTAEGNDDLGWEFNASLGYKIHKNVSALIKYAHFEGNTQAYKDIDRAWAQVEVTF